MDAAADGPLADDAPAATCSGLFCDGFDEGVVRWHGTEIDDGARAEAATFGRRGGSLLAESPIGTQTAAAFVDVLSPLPADVYVRAFVYVPRGGTLDLEPIAVSSVPPTHQIVASLYDDGVDVHAHGMAGDFSEIASMMVPRERWLCLELHVSVGASGQVDLFIDDTRVAARSSLDTRPPSGALPRVSVGIPSNPIGIAGRIHIDDVVVAAQRIGCQ